MSKLSKKVFTFLLIISLTIPSFYITSINAKDSNETTITILSTADLHGRIYPYDYATDSEDPDAGISKIQTLVKQEKAKNKNSILIDCGDTVQDNLAELFNSKDVHPMVEAMNYMQYDTWTLGNHEFNFGLDFLNKNIKGFNGEVLAANIYKKDGTRYTNPYKIIEKNGVKVAIVGLIPPHIPTWEASTPDHFKGLTFTDPVVEAKKVVKELKGKYDVLVGALHLGDTAELGETDGSIAIANSCPEFSVIFCGHKHSSFNNQIVNGVKLIEPGSYGFALAKADIILKKSNNSWKVTSVNTKNLETKDIKPDKEILDKFSYVHKTSLEEANKVVGEISKDFIEKPDYITGKDTVTTMPTAQVQDTALIDLINEVQLFYSKADISSAALFNFDSNLKKGDFKKKDVSFIYKYTNTLNGVNIKGKNLKKYMEWSASYYNIYKKGDLTVSFNPEIRGYNYDMFSNVNYDINISKPSGSRIQNLTFKGKPVEDDKIYKLAVNNYRLGTLLELKLVSSDDVYYDSYKKYQDAGRIRDLIIKYIQEQKNGKLTPSVDNNWKITGTNFDNTYVKQLMDKIIKGELTIPKSEDGRTLNVKSITINDIKDKTLDTNKNNNKNEKNINKNTSKTIKYIVKKGDVLSRIAVKYNLPWRKLANVNNLKNPHLIFPGQVINIPIK